MSDLVKFLSVLASEVMPLNKVKELVVKYGQSNHNNLDPAVGAIIQGWLKEASTTTASTTAKTFISAVDPMTVMANMREPKTVKDVIEEKELQPTSDILKNLPWSDFNSNSYKKPEPVLVENEFSELPWDKTKDTTVDKYIEMTDEEHSNLWKNARELVKGVEVDLNAPLEDDEDDFTASSIGSLVASKPSPFKRNKAVAKKKQSTFKKKK